MKKYTRKIMSIAMLVIISANILSGCSPNTKENTSEKESVIHNSNEEYDVESSNIVKLEDDGSVTAGNTSEKECVIHNSNGEYYIKSSNIVKLEDDGSVTAVKYNGAEEETNAISISDEKSVYVDDAIYAQQSDITTELYKFDFTNKTDTMERSVWVDEETLLNSDVAINSNYTGNMSYWNADGDYVYFICNPTMDYFQSEKSIAYRLGRISKDGKTIEFIGEETASAYTVKDGWIYFYDNGYTYESNNFNIDYERAGIYKMKGDGSEKTLLLDGFEPDDRINNYIFDEYNTLCDKMNIYNDYLYFIDYSVRGESRVCRVKLDGSGYERISDNGAYCYTINLDKNNMYYASGEGGYSRTGKRTIYEASLKDNAEKELFEYGSIGEPVISYYNGYLYFKNCGQFVATVNDKGVSGMRYNLVEEKMERLYGYYEIEKTTDGIFESQNRKGPYFYWEEYTSDYGY